MPKVNGIGFGEATAEKHRHVNGLLRMHATMVRGVWKSRRFAQPYQYVDLTAGLGEFEGGPTAPVAISHFLGEENIPAIGLSYERCAETCMNLRTHLAPYKWHHLIGADFCGRLLEDGRRRLAKPHRDAGVGGIIYYDPTEYRDFDRHMAEIRRAFELPYFRDMELLINLQATTLKRMRCSEQCQIRCQLETLLETIPKRQFLIREPIAANQFTLILGTNWSDFPTWSAAGFAKVASADGREILDRLCLTKTERANGVHIELTRNTLGTLNFSRCEVS